MRSCCFFSSSSIHCMSCSVAAKWISRGTNPTTHLVASKSGSEIVSHVERLGGWLVQPVRVLLHLFLAPSPSPSLPHRSSHPELARSLQSIEQASGRRALSPRCTSTSSPCTSISSSLQGRCRTCGTGRCVYIGETPLYQPPQERTRPCETLLYCV